MRRPSGRCTPNSVQVLPASFAADAAGGRVLSVGAPAATLACTVQASSSLDVPDHMREAGVLYLTVILHDDPAGFGGLKVRDRVVWVDGGITLTVWGPPQDAAGRSRSWRIPMFYRPER